VTLGAVNFPEVNLRSLTLDESNHARVSYVKAGERFILTCIGHLHPPKCARCFKKRCVSFQKARVLLLIFAQSMRFLVTTMLINRLLITKEM
jgi:hypothetical protein